MRRAELGIQQVGREYQDGNWIALYMVVYIAFQTMVLVLKRVSGSLQSPEL
jgi:RNase P/RNase MRP subunit POP5